MIAQVAYGSLRSARNGRGAGGPARTQLGHWKPTDACTMQSGQIGRLQR